MKRGNGDGWGQRPREAQGFSGGAPSNCPISWITEICCVLLTSINGKSCLHIYLLSLAIWRVCIFLLFSYMYEMYFSISLPFTCSPPSPVNPLLSLPVYSRVCFLMTQWVSLDCVQVHSFPVFPFFFFFFNPILSDSPLTSEGVINVSLPPEFQVIPRGRNYLLFNQVRASVIAAAHCKIQTNKIFGQGCLVEVDADSNHSYLERCLMGPLYPISKTIAVAFPPKPMISPLQAFDYVL